MTFEADDDRAARFRRIKKSLTQTGISLSPPSLTETGGGEGGGVS